MGKERDRTEKLADAAEKIEKGIFADSIRMLEREYQKEAHREKVKEAFEKVFLGWSGRNGRNVKGKMEGGRAEPEDKAGCMGICYMHSSILMRTYEFRIVIYNEEFYLDRCPVIYSWRPPYFFEAFEEDMKKVMRKLSQNYPRICRLEEDAVRFRCAEYYLASVSALCADMMEEICSTDGFGELERADDFFIFYGRYRGEGKILYRAEKKKDIEGRSIKGTAGGKKEYLRLDSQDGNSLPDIVDWYKKIDIRYLNRADYRKLPRYIVLDMKTGEDTVYPDILTFPALMVSPEAMEVIWKYQPGFPSLFIILFDTAREESISYCCPILEEGSEEEEIGEVLYKIHTEKGSELRIQLELAESLLWRGASGMELTHFSSAAVCAGMGDSADGKE